MTTSKQPTRIQVIDILESISDAFFSLSHEWIFTYLNAQAEQLLQRPREELIGRNIWDTFPEIFNFIFYQMYHKAMTEGVPVHFEVRYPPLDTWFEIHAHPTPDGLSVYFRNINERKRAEEELKARARQQAAVAELSQRALAGTDLADLMNYAVALIAQTLIVDYSETLELLPDDNRLLLRTGTGWKKGLVGHATVDAIPDSQASYTLYSQQPVIIDDLGKETHFKGHSLLQDHGVVSGISIVIPGQTRPFGLLSVYTRNQRSFSNDDAYFMRVVASTLAIAIQRKRLEEAQRKSAREATERARELEAIFEAMTDAVIVYNEKAEIVQANAAFRELVGIDAQPDFLSSSLAERGARIEPRDEHDQPLPEDHWPVLRILNGEVFKGRHALDIMMRTLDGREVEISLSGTPMRDSEGHIVGGIAILHEVTERRQLERRGHETLDALLAMAAALVQVPQEINESTSVTASSAGVREAGQRLVELTCRVLNCQRVGVQAIEAETGVIRPMAVCGLSPQQEQQWWKEQEQQQSRLSDSPDPALVSVLQANEVLILDMTKPPFQDLPNPYHIHTMLVAPMCLGDQLVGMLSLDYGGAEHDYTKDEIDLAKTVARLAALVIERDRLLREREEARANEFALREANRRMDEFLSIASHELRTPLTTIKGNIQLIQLRLKNLFARDMADVNTVLSTLKNVQEILERADRQVGIQNRLVGDLLDVSRNRMNKLELDVEPCDLVAIADQVVQEQRTVAPTRIILWEMPTTEQVQVMADDDRIGQVINNYLTNALKYSAPDRPVEVSLRVEDSVARISVRDEGPGLPPEEQERIWDRFYQAQGITMQSGSGKGMGLGLHICKTIIAQHNGEVGVQSTPGTGSTFWFTLPLIK